MLWEDGSFQVLERINDNTYKVDLSGKYGVGVGVSVTFNVSDLSLFDVDDDSWMDPFKKRVDNMIKTTPKNLLQILIRSITRLKAKGAQRCIQWAYSEYLG